MNIQQLEYVVAVDNFRHFAKAAEACRVTQPTLSMMIQKLEDELEVKLFDRTKHPVEPTAIGQQIISQARVSLKHFQQVKAIVENEQQIVGGDFKLGIIPTIASYLVPVLLHQQMELGCGVELRIKECTTANIIREIQTGILDGGILAGPLNHPALTEHPVYYEKFYAYVSPLDRLHEEKDVDLAHVDINSVWLLENEHCLRGQIERLCRIKRKMAAGNAHPIKFESGSIDTLINVVDYNPGLTIIPEMHAMGLNEDKQENLRPFRNVTAVREVSLAVSRDYVRRTMISFILDLIRRSVPKSMQDPQLKSFVVDL
ncbi:MAG: hydrogen peroxide-inducible genes activator [Tannerella sp.]|jgi:LysR family hydrogen peroxide-inducible transcriptional activator|nr:hydrogen peroxide-inducible genes activator [Tannerella sp.]